MQKGAVRTFLIFALAASVLANTLAASAGDRPAARGNWGKCVLGSRMACLELAAKLGTKKAVLARWTVSDVEIYPCKLKTRSTARRIIEVCSWRLFMPENSYPAQRWTGQSRVTLYKRTRTVNLLGVSCANVNEPTDTGAPCT